MPKTILLTGASSGIGRVTAELMARRGWQVAATSRNPAALEAWAAPLKIAVLPLDLTDAASIAAVVAATAQRFGTIDVLVNNAGYGLFGPVEGTSADAIARQFQTNVFGQIALIQQVMPLMRARRSGTIINVTSMGGRFASPFASLYGATKFAMEGFTESFRFEASLHGVRLKLVEPAHFKTGFMGPSLETTAHEAYDAPFTNFMAYVHEEDRRAQSPEPVARVILKAAEDPSSRLRYPVHGALMLALIRILPDAIWRSLVAQGMTRPLKRRR